MFDPDFPDLIPPPRQPMVLGEKVLVCCILALSAVLMTIVTWQVVAWLIRLPWRDIARFCAAVVS